MTKLMVLGTMMLVVAKVSAGDLPIIAHWSFDKDHDTTMLLDSGPNKINVPLTSAATDEKVKTVEGVIGQALELTGEEKGTFRVNNENLNLRVPFSIACWVKIKSGREANNSILVNAWDSNKKGYRLLASWQRFFYRWGDGTEMNSIATKHGSVPLDKWCHLTATNDGESIKLYVNGSVNTSFEGDNLQHVPNDSPIGIGTYFGTKNYRFVGSMDEFYIFSRALSENEVFELAAKQVLSTSE